MMGFERTGCSATGNIVQHRRFYFQKATVVQVLPDTLDDLRPFNKRILYFRMDDKIQIALAVTRFFIGQAMEFFRQRTQGLGKQCPLFYAYCRFTGMCRKDRAFYADNVTNVEQLKEIIRFFA